MKVLNPMESYLCDHEVLQHITAMKARYTHVHETQGAVHAMKAGNLETVMKEVLQLPLSYPPFRILSDFGYY